MFLEIYIGSFHNQAIRHRSFRECYIIEAYSFPDVGEVIRTQRKRSKGLIWKK